MEEHGVYYYNRIDLHLEEAQKQKLMNFLKIKTPKSFANKKVVDIQTLDGFKMFFEDDSWILFRASGTEPLLRIYSEARSSKDLKLILGAGEKLATTI
jgi:phosphomannomutase